MRKLFPAMLLCAMLAACAGSSTDNPISSTTPTSLPTGITPPMYQVAADEPLPNAKKLAAEIAQTVTSYPASNDPRNELIRRLVTLGAPASIADNAASLLQAGRTSRGEVVYPQLGGFRNGKVSMMVATRQTIGEDDAVVRVLDIRLQLENQTWKAVSIDSVGGQQLDEPDDLTPAQRAVLDNPAIELTDSARWDIYRNRVDTRLLETLDRFAEQHRFSILVFAEGHPVNVFESDKTSNHTKGRAADVWKLDGNTIVAQRNDTLRGIQQKLLDAGMTELGGPFDLDGPMLPRSFADIVHQDHLHLAYQE